MVPSAGIRACSFTLPGYTQQEAVLSVTQNSRRPHGPLSHAQKALHIASAAFLAAGLSLLPTVLLHAQTAAPVQAVTQQSAAAAYGITPEEQAGIDKDTSRHFGDAPLNPGPRANLSGSLDPADVRAALRKVADWQLDRSQPYFDRIWTWSVLYAGFMAVSPALHDPRYRDAMQSMAEKFHWELRSPHPNADDQSLAQTYLELYLLNPAPEKIQPTEGALANVIAGQGPRIPPVQAQIPWWWCDALFMAPPVWTRMYAATHEQKYLDYLDKNFWQTSDLLYDTQRHLYFRDITFLHKTDKRGNPIFWSRGEGWVMAGIARTLEYLPESDPDYHRYVTQLQQMSAAVAALQDPKDGMWHADMLDPEDFPQPETSGSALITFALAWGVNHQILDSATYMPVIEKAWGGLVSQIYADGRLGNIQQTGAEPAHYLPSSSYTYGVGGFLLAGAQVLDLPSRAAEAAAPPAHPTAFHLVCVDHAHSGEQALAGTRYQEGKQNFGFDLTASPQVSGGTCHADSPFFVSVTEPDGDYRVTVVLGNNTTPAVTTVKAEARRLMLEQVSTQPRQKVRRSFVVNLRTPEVKPGESVHLKPREIGNLDWDQKLTLEFIGQHPSVRSIRIAPVQVPTVYIAGDSTVVDQDKEPWAAWGQMLPVFFNDKIAVANEAESGETIASFVGEKRFDKIFSTIRPGDYLMMQFAHNDQKPGRGFVPIPKYKELLVHYIKLAREHGAHPILVTSMNRRFFLPDGKIKPTLGDYPEAMREVAREEKAPLIDLNAMSATLFEAMGPEGTLKAFVHYPANTFPDQPKALADNTHFNSYGALELAKCVVQSMREQHLALAKFLRRGIPPFHPAHPDPPSIWSVPPDPFWSMQTPYER